MANLPVATLEQVYLDNARHLPIALPAPLAPLAPAPAPAPLAPAPAPLAPAPAPLAPAPAH
jgi:hypothetical protein